MQKRNSKKVLPTAFWSTASQGGVWNGSWSGARQRAVARGVVAHLRLKFYAIDPKEDYWFPWQEGWWLI